MLPSMECKPCNILVAVFCAFQPSSNPETKRTLACSITIVRSAQGIDVFLRQGVWSIVGTVFHSKCRHPRGSIEPDPSSMNGLTVPCLSIHLLVFDSTRANEPIVVAHLVRNILWSKLAVMTIHASSPRSSQSGSGGWDVYK